MEIDLKKAGVSPVDGDRGRGNVMPSLSVVTPHGHLVEPLNPWVDRMAVENCGVVAAYLASSRSGVRA